MQKFMLLILLSVLTNVTIQAQQGKGPAMVTWGESIKEPSGSFISKVIASGKYGFYALRQKREGAFSGERAYAEFYDSAMRLQRSTKLELKYKGKVREFEDLVMVGGRLYLLTSFNNRAKRKNYLFRQEVDKKSLQPNAKLKKMGEIDSRDEYRDGAFSLVVSSDSSKVLVHSQLPYERRQPERFAFQVYDQEFNTLWKKDIALPYSDGSFTVEEYQVDDQGNVYLLGIIYSDSRMERGGSPTYQYTILAYRNNGEDFQEYRIALDDKFITDLTFRIDRKGELVCTGFYSDRGVRSVKGTYYLKIDPQSQAVSSQNLMAFEFDFLTETLSDRKKARAMEAQREGDTDRTPELYRFSLDKLILRSDGGALLVAEQFYRYERVWRTWDGLLQTDFFYHYNDLIVVNIRPDGTIEWATRIPKRQETVNDGGYYSSYAMSIVRDKIYFIFNDNPRNFNPDSNRLYNYNGKSSVIALVELRKDGEYSAFPLFNNRDADVVTRPIICKQIGSRKMMIYGEWGSRYRFGTLEFLNRL
ncbi:MAG: hypothetical protein AAF798_09930 [Bacteroidota bacterium]